MAGPEGDRTELLSIIRSTLTELFTEYRADAAAALPRRAGEAVECKCGKRP